MRKHSKYHGVVVPMVTPFTADHKLDEASFNRLVDFLILARVDGIFVMGTTGEGIAIPHGDRIRIVELTLALTKGRIKIFAGISNSYPNEVNAGNHYLHAGVDAVVLYPPIGMHTEKILPWCENLLENLDGPMLLYNMPLTTKFSIPLDVLERLAPHPRLAGIKDSENNSERQVELLRRFSGNNDFSIFIGVGVLMENGLKLGADGIVPSVGNLIPEVCRQLCAAAKSGDWEGAHGQFLRMNAVAALYQKGRTLNESLSALKAALHFRGLCLPHVLPPLHALNPAQSEKLRDEMQHLHLLNGES